MNGDVVVETLHLTIDLFTHESMKETTLAIVCDSREIADELLEAREQRRATLETIQRVHWMKAAGDLDFKQDAIDSLSFHLDKVCYPNRTRCRLPFITPASLLDGPRAATGNIRPIWHRPSCAL